MIDPIVALGWALAAPVVAFFVWVWATVLWYHRLHIEVEVRRRLAARALAKAEASRPKRAGDIDVFLTRVRRSLAASRRWVTARDRLEAFEQKWGIE